MAIIVLPEPINAQSAEKIFRRANEMANQPVPALGYADAGLMAAVMKNPYLMKAMEDLAEVIDKIAENQLGQTRRAASATFAASIEPAQAVIVREAYRTMDEGKPAPQYGFLYAAAAELQGLISAK